MSVENGPAPPAHADQSVSDLVRQLSDQTTRLMRAEVELAKSELAQKGKQAGIGAGMFGGAGVFALYGGGALVAAAIAGLSTAVDTWLAALIVAVVLFAVAGVVALLGKKRLEAAGPPVPEAAIETTRRDVEVAKARVKEARTS
jgi:MFS family permease